MSLAERNLRWDDNSEGRFYTDRSCILCCLCAEMAPFNFRESLAGDHDIVYKQPENAEQERQCLEALLSCPVSAIGND
ncbi:MAG TPA: ferredoxin [Acidobacteriota bacterium]